MLVWSIVYCYDGTQRYEQFLQVGRLYWALILLGSALLSFEHFCVCLVLYLCSIFGGYISFFTF